MIYKIEYGLYNINCRGRVFISASSMEQAQSRAARLARDLFFRKANENRIRFPNQKKLYEKVRIKIDETSKLRNIKGGQTGKKHSSYTQEEIEYLCNEFTKAFNNNNKEEIMSLREFAEKYSIPKSTLYDILTKYVTDNDLSMIKSLFEFNKRHK